MKALLIITATLFSSLLSQAQMYGGAISASAGGTGRAAVESGTAGFINPAMLVHQRGRQFYTALTQDNLALSFTENTDDSPIPSSLGYWQKTTEIVKGSTSTPYKLQDLRLSLAEFVKGGLSVGITGHYYQVQGPLKVPGQGNLDIGFGFTPAPNIGLALVVYDLGSVNSEIPEEFRIASSVGVGFQHIFRDTFRTRVDIVSGPDQNFGKSTAMLGFESYLNQWVIFRGGTQSNHYLGQDLLSLGIGFDLPLFRANYAYQFVATDSKDQRHSVDLSIPF